MDATSQMVMWRNAITKEQAAARAHYADWGFLHEKHDDKEPRDSYAVRPTKYYDAGGATVKLKRLPLLPQDRTAAGSTQAPDVEDLISTRTFQGPRPMTALDSTTYSHAKSLHTIRSVDPFLRTTSQTYGSRLPIEQFGVAHHGHVESAITRWDRREHLI